MGVGDGKIIKKGPVERGIITEETAAPLYQEMYKYLLITLQIFIEYPSWTNLQELTI